MTPRAILLDSLGTLLELQPPAPRLQAELKARYGVEVGLAEAGRALAAEIAFYREHLDQGRDGPSLTRLRERCAAELRDALPQAVQPCLPPPAELVDVLLASLQFRAYPDSRPALVSYRQAGVRLVVVSNWDVSLHEVLSNLGLSPLLDAILTAAEAGVRKPAPAIFRQALRLAGTGADEAIHVGDSLEEDVVGARAAGIEPVLLARNGREPPEGVRTIRSLSEPLS